jgi:hypothetical protein
MQGLAVENTPDGFFPSGVLKKDMKIVVQNRKTNAFLTQDAKWVQRFESARQFTTSLEALRFCADRQLRETDMLVCYPGARSNMRVPLI